MRSYYFTFSAVNPFPTRQTSRITDSIDIVAACACADAFEKTVLTIKTIIAFCTKHKKRYVHFINLLSWWARNDKIANHGYERRKRGSYIKYKFIPLSSPQIILKCIFYLTPVTSVTGKFTYDSTILYALFMINGVID